MKSILKVTLLCSATAFAGVADAQASAPPPSDAASQIAPDGAVAPSLKADRWTITAFASNLFNKDYINDDVVAPEFGGDFVAPGNLRRYGVEALFKF